MIQLFSGGLDSLMIYRLLEPHRAIYVRLGTKAQEKELDVIAKITERYNVEIIMQDCSMAAVEMGNGYVPYRNPILALLAAQHDPFVIVSQIAEWAPDKNRRFWHRLTGLARQAGMGSFQGVAMKPTITAPFADVTKAELLVEYHKRFGGDETAWLLKNTWSCYNDGAIHCGDCSGCRQRLVAELVTGLFGTVYEDAFIPEMPMRHWADAVRWVRDNRSVSGLVKRGREQRTAIEIMRSFGD